VVLVAGIIAAALEERGLAIAFMSVYMALILGWTAVRLRTARRVQRKQHG
jgi:hypothetical protein